MPPVPVSPLGVAVAPLRLMPTMAERQCASEAGSSNRELKPKPETLNPKPLSPKP